jgi:hypothetical protein
MSASYHNFETPLFAGGDEPPSYDSALMRSRLLRLVRWRRFPHFRVPDLPGARPQSDGWRVWSSHEMVLSSVVTARSSFRRLLTIKSHLLGVPDDHFVPQ